MPVQDNRPPKEEQMMGEHKHRLDRRRFLAAAGRTLACLSLSLGGALLPTQGSAELSPAFGDPEGNSNLHEAMFYERVENDHVRCRLCFRTCRIPPTGRGHCGVRENRGGTLYSLVYGRMAAATFGTVEQKPLYHYRPGARAYNFGTAGCNLNCKFCHNHMLSQRTPEEIGDHEQLTPKEAVSAALERGIDILSFTYNEPTVFYEFMFDTARLARGEDMGVNVNTNAAMSEAALWRLFQYADSATVDLKGFSERFYRDVCGGRLEPVLENLRLLREAGIWIEVVNLVIPDLNDDPELIREMCAWLFANLGPGTPLHYSRFFPAYRLTHLEPTPIPTLERAREIALEEGLQYVSIGNVPGHRHNSTFCPACGEVLIRRHHFTVQEVNIVDGGCASCGHHIPGTWD